MPEGSQAGLSMRDRQATPAQTLSIRLAAGAGLPIESPDEQGLYDLVITGLAWFEI